MDTFNKNSSRRQFLGLVGGALGAAALAGSFPNTARADDLPHLTLDDPTAQALGYTEDSSKVDAAKFPTHKPEQACASCNFFQGGTNAYGPCQLFAGKAVNAKGWCSGYAKKA
jgi:High potential iron-sulfur protein